MAGITLQRGVRSNQRETVLVILDGLDGDVPTLYRVALLAISAHLPFVNIGVTISASRAHIREDRLGVTLATPHILVHAAQRILGFVVIEFGHSTDRLPPNRSMAVLTRNVQISVRTSGLREVLVLSAGGVIRREEGQ